MSLATRPTRWRSRYGDTHRAERAIGRAGGSRATGLNHVVIAPNRYNCPPHVHAAEEEIFVVLKGEGNLLLYDCDTRPQAPPLLSLVSAGDCWSVLPAAGSPTPSSRMRWGSPCWHTVSDAATR